MSTYLSACLLACLFTYLPTYLPAYLPTYQPTYLPAYIPACLHTCLPPCVSTHLRIKPPPYLLSLYLSIYPSIHPSIYLSIHLLPHSRHAIHTHTHRFLQNVFSLVKGMKKLRNAKQSDASFISFIQRENAFSQLPKRCRKTPDRSWMFGFLLAFLMILEGDR